MQQIRMLLEICAAAAAAVAVDAAGCIWLRRSRQQKG